MTAETTVGAIFDSMPVPRREDATARQAAQDLVRVNRLPHDQFVEACALAAIRSEGLERILLRNAAARISELLLELQARPSVHDYRALLPNAVTAQQAMVLAGAHATQQQAAQIQAGRLHGHGTRTSSWTPSSSSVGTAEVMPAELTIPIPPDRR